MWLIEFFEYGYSTATRIVYSDFMVGIFGTEWAGIIIVLLTYYFIFQTIAFIYNTLKRR